MNATIYTYTVIRSTTEAFTHLAPYLVTVLENESGRFTAFVDGYQDGTPVAIGQTVIYDHTDEAGHKFYKLA